MSDDKKKGRGSVDTARRIWLAGIGAYGRAFTEAQEAIKDMSGETSWRGKPRTCGENQPNVAC